MHSLEPFQERMINELIELEEKQSKLKKFLDNNSVSTTENLMLLWQMSGMVTYQTALLHRVQYYNLKNDYLRLKEEKKK